MTSDGQPYGPIRYRQIVKECYIISKNCNTAYTDVLNITPTERQYLIDFLSDEYAETQKRIEQTKLAQNSKR